jgi:predicted bacteriocin transport accessory protein
MKKAKPIPEKSLQVISCALAVVVMILLMSGDMIMSKILRVNPNQDYPYDINKGSDEKVNSSVDIDVSLNYDVSFMKETNLVELRNLILTGNTIYVFSGRSTCPPCKKFVPVLKNVTQELQLTNVYYLNQSEIDEKTEGYQEFTKFSPLLQEEFGTTPFLMVFKDQKYQEGQIGTMGTDEVFTKYLKEIFQKY